MYKVRYTVDIRNDSGLLVRSIGSFVCIEQAEDILKEVRLSWPNYFTIEIGVSYE